MAFETTFDFYRKLSDGSFDKEPASYSLKTDTFPLEPSQIRNIIFEAIELEGFDSEEFLLHMETEADGKYVNGDECVVYPEHITRTNNPSAFIRWDHKIPTIFAIDRDKSSFRIEI